MSQPRPDQVARGIAQVRSRAEELIPSKLFALRYSTDRGEQKLRLILVVGEDVGERTVYQFPEKLGSNLGVYQCHTRIAQQVCNLLDGKSPEGDDLEPFDEADFDEVVPGKRGRPRHGQLGHMRGGGLGQ